MLSPLLAILYPLAHLNALLNFTAGLLLLRGVWLIKQKREEAHRKTMQAALIVSILFLISYLTHHAQVGSLKFPETGWVKTLYLGLLLPHILLAALVVPLALLTVRFGNRSLGRSFFGKSLPAEKTNAEIAAKYRKKHRKLARLTFPIWLYVSISGIIVYIMLYHLYPPIAG